MTNHVLRILVLCAAFAWPIAQAADPVDAAVASGNAVAAAIASPDRPKADLERDAVARPAEVLAFLGVAPGMRVADMFSAGGYYTELLARMALSHGASLVINSDSHAPGDLTSLSMAKNVALGAGLSEGQFELCRRHSEALVKKALALR